MWRSSESRRDGEGAGERGTSRKPQAGRAWGSSCEQAHTAPACSQRTLVLPPGLPVPPVVWWESPAVRLTIFRSRSGQPQAFAGRGCLCAAPDTREAARAIRQPNLPDNRDENPGLLRDRGFLPDGVAFGGRWVPSRSVNRGAPTSFLRGEKIMRIRNLEKLKP